jgi:hypothetical protein
MPLLQAKTSFERRGQKRLADLGSYQTEVIYLVWEVERKAPKVFADLSNCFSLYAYKSTVNSVAKSNFFDNDTCFHCVVRTHQWMYLVIVLIDLPSLWFREPFKDSATTRTVIGN